jgi:hypothetical protein
MIVTSYGSVNNFIKKEKRKKRHSGTKRMVSTHVCSHFQLWSQPFLYGKLSDTFFTHPWNSKFTNGHYYYSDMPEKYSTTLLFHYFNVKKYKSTGMYRYILDPQLMSELCLKALFVTNILQPKHIFLPHKK